MKTRIIFFALAIIMITSQSIAQTIASDSRGKEVFNFYKSKAFSIPVTASTAAFKLNYTVKVGKGTQYYVARYKNAAGVTTTKGTEIKFMGGKQPYTPDDSLRFTLSKSTGINFGLGVGNLLSNLAKVSTFHPTYSLTAGIGKNIDAFNNWDNISTIATFFTCNLNGYIKWDNLILYDTISKIQNRIHPFSKGITGEWTQYFPVGTGKKVWLTSISASANYEFGNNISQLKDFQKNKPNYTNTDVISLGDVIGKLGDLKNQDAFRFRLSAPLFPTALRLFRDQSAETATSGRKFKDSVQFCIVPYWTFYGPVNTKLTNIIGLYVNATQGQNLFSKNSTVVAGFGLGIDWTVAADGISNASVFVAGSLDLHQLFEHKKTKKQ